MRKKLILFLVVLFSAVVLVGCFGVKVESVTVSGPTSGFVGDEITLSVTVLPTDAKDKSVTWSSSDNSLATVIGGKVTLIKKGEVTITAQSGKQKGTHDIVIKEVETIATESIEITGLNSGKVGDTIDLTAKVLPLDATNKEVTWTTTDSTVATVNENGVVTLIAVGETLIIAKQGTIDSSILITVTPSVVATTGLEIIGPSEAEIGDEITLVAKILPETATNQEVIWSSMDTSIATVTGGVVTILAGGTVEIQARQGNKIFAYHEINVTVATTSIVIEEIETIVAIGDIINLTAEVYPANATNRNLTWTSTDEEIATVSDGKVTFLQVGEVTIKANQGEIEDTLSFTVYEALIAADDIIIEADSVDGIVGDELNILGRIQPSNATFSDLSWSSNDEDVAVIEDGVVTLKSIGRVVITATSKEVSKEFEIRVYDDLEYIWNKFRDARKRTVKVQTIRQYGATTVDNDLFPSVFPYRFYDEIVIDKTYMLPDDHPAHPNVNRAPEWVVVHDTGNINTDAEGNASFQKNQGDVSWQYTVGNDGIFQSLADNKVSWHASSGSTTAGFTDTGIPAVNPGERPKMTLDNDYYVIKGIKTNIKAPASVFVDTGMWPVIINGTYHIPDASNRGEKIGLDGGNYDGIGIETSVFSGGDVWITWHRTAKLVASLLVKHDLLLDRIVFHNSFNNKTCPQTAIRSNNLENWVDLMKFEYMILTKFADYQFDLTPLSTVFLDNTGRVINDPSKGIVPVTGNFFDYILKITAPNGDVKEQTFRTTVG